MPFGVHCAEVDINYTQIVYEVLLHGKYLCTRICFSKYLEFSLRSLLRIYQFKLCKNEGTANLIFGIYSLCDLSKNINSY